MASSSSSAAEGGGSLQEQSKQDKDDQFKLYCTLYKESINLQTELFNLNPKEDPEKWTSLTKMVDSAKKRLGDALQNLEDSHDHTFTVSHHGDLELLNGWRAAGFWTGQTVYISSDLPAADQQFFQDFLAVRFTSFRVIRKPPPYWEVRDGEVDFPEVSTTAKRDDDVQRGGRGSVRGRGRRAR